MLISELPQPYRYLAELRTIQDSGYYEKYLTISSGFLGENTPEGFVFWDTINDKNIFPPLKTRYKIRINADYTHTITKMWDENECLI